MPRKPATGTAKKTARKKPGLKPGSPASKRFTDAEVAKHKVTIVEKMCNGDSLKRICRDDDMPSHVTVYKWIAADLEFANAYTNAVKIRASKMFDEILEIADDGTNDYVTEDGRTSLDSEHVQRSKLRLDTRKWVLARMDPGKYGDRQVIDLNAQIDLKTDEELTRELEEARKLIGVLGLK